MIDHGDTMEGGQAPRLAILLLSFLFIFLNRTSVNLPWTSSECIGVERMFKDAMPARSGRESAHRKWISLRPRGL